MKTFDARTRQRWRDWLARHHDTESEVWLIFHKKHTGRPSVAYLDSLDEALCFGWIDSLIKRIDDDRYARKFTPRTDKSSWSSINVKRYAALKAAGKLAAPGKKRAPGTRIADRPRPTATPKYIEAALRHDPAVWTAFEGLAPWQRRNYIIWIDTAKRDETKAKRLKKAMDALKKGDPLGLQ